MKQRYLTPATSLLVDQFRPYCVTLRWVPREGRVGARTDRVIPRTLGRQFHKVTSNTRIDQIFNQIGNEAPTLIPPWVKNSNIGSSKTVIHLCAEVTHELPERRRPKPIKILLSNRCKAHIQLVCQSKLSSVAYSWIPADIIIMTKHFCVYFHCVQMNFWELRKKIF